MGEAAGRPPDGPEGLCSRGGATWWDLTVGSRSGADVVRTHQRPGPLPGLSG